MLTHSLACRLLSLGPVFGPILCCIMAVQHWFFWLLEWYDPRAEIEYVDEGVWSADRFSKVCAISACLFHDYHTPDTR